MDPLFAILDALVNLLFVLKVFELVWEPFEQLLAILEFKLQRCLSSFGIAFFLAIVP